MCLYSRLILNPKYKANKKNNYSPPLLTDERVKYVPIGCKQCIECKKQKAREWQTRLLEDIKTNKNAKFITLTFNNESIRDIKNAIDKESEQMVSTKLEGYELDNKIATWATRHFLERWRKTYKKSLRHWFVTELGHQGTENIHIHGIIWTTESLASVEQHWKYGYMWKGKEYRGNTINYVNESTINYITKYVNKIDEKHKTYNSVILTSPGIGNNYTRTYDAENNRFQEKKTNETYRTRSGHKISLCIYWRNKLYNEKERESLWLYKLDKQERWVRGEKISIKNGEEKYFKLLEWHQKQNTELGYGNDKINWEKKEYEKQLRNFKIQERISRADQQKKQYSPTY